MNCPENKLKELSEPTPDSFYINGKKIYTEAYVQELERQIEVAINASADLWQVRKGLEAKLAEAEKFEIEYRGKLAIAIEAIEEAAYYFKEDNWEGPMTAMDEALTKISSTREINKHNDGNVAEILPDGRSKP